MPSIHVDLENLERRPGSAKYGAAALHEGNHRERDPQRPPTGRWGSGFAVEGFTATRKAGQNRRTRALR